MKIAGLPKRGKPNTTFNKDFGGLAESASYTSLDDSTEPGFIGEEFCERNCKLAL
jgi:hypothetical protein